MPRRLSALSCVAASLLASITLVQPAKAQFWGYQYPDGSIRGRGGYLLQGPDPSYRIREMLTLPTQRQTIDLNTGIRYRGGLMQSGPDPSVRLSACYQLGIC